MEKREFHVELISRRRVVYSVLAPDKEAARRMATEKWHRCEPSDLGALDWSELEDFRAVEAVDSSLENQDDEVLLRFIHERERLLLRLGSTFVSATANDAISALQAATDLGWSVPDTPRERPEPDSLRAAKALERLCAQKRLVCFERPRSRQGELGEIRLYCTPEYLESLSRTFKDVSANAVS